MIILNERIYRCEECSKKLNDKAHLKMTILNSGLMIPPFTGGVPEKELEIERRDLHFCDNNGKCFIDFIRPKLIKSKVKSELKIEASV